MLQISVRVLHVKKKKRKEKKKRKKTGGNWSIQESKQHINILEALAVYFALKLYCKNLTDMKVHFKIDSTVAGCCINKQTPYNY